MLRHLMREMRRQPLQNAKGKLGADTMGSCEMFCFGFFCQEEIVATLSKCLNLQTMTVYICVPLTGALQSVTTGIL